MLLLMIAALAQAQPLPDGLYKGVGGALGERWGTEVPVHAHVGGSSQAYLRGPLTPHHPVLISTANDNRTYWYITQIWRPLWRAWPYLFVDDVAYMGSWSGRGPRTELWVSIPAQAADRLVDVPRRDRTELGQGLHSRFSAPVFERGGPMPITLHLSHSGDPVRMMVGGRQRGPRNNRFSFEVFQDGQPLPVIDAPDFGGPGGWVQIERGHTSSLDADLSSWVHLREAGSYEVRASYGTEVAPPGGAVDGPDRLHERWDVVFEQVFTVVVR